MKKKMVLSFAGVVLFANSLFADMNKDKIDEKMHKNMMVKHYYMKAKPMRHHRFGDMITSKIMMLDLTKEQYKQIKKIIHAKDKTITNPLDAFSENSFDEDKFVKSMQTNKEARLKNKAQKISKIYNLLTKEQKKDLRTILDMEKIMKKKFSKKIHVKPEFQG